MNSDNLPIAWTTSVSSCSGNGGPCGDNGSGRCVNGTVGPVPSPGTNTSACQGSTGPVCLVPPIDPMLISNL